MRIDKQDAIAIGIIILWAIGGLVSLGIAGFLVYVAWHFIQKFW